jgi:hypothetical protein
MGAGEQQSPPFMAPSLLNYFNRRSSNGWKCFPLSMVSLLVIGIHSSFCQNKPQGKKELKTIQNAIHLKKKSAHIMF